MRTCMHRSVGGWLGVLGKPRSPKSVELVGLGPRNNWRLWGVGLGQAPAHCIAVVLGEPEPWASPGLMHIHALWAGACGKPQPSECNC